MMTTTVPSSSLVKEKKVQKVGVNAYHSEKYPNFFGYTTYLLPPERPVLNREKEINSVLAGLCRPEVSNVALLGEAGVGKTSIVLEMARKAKNLHVFEVDLARMGAKGSNEMASILKNLVDEAIMFQREQDRLARKAGEDGYRIVLFMDEFHQIVELSPASVEAIKPILAKSGLSGLQLVVATTVEEFQKYIEPNEALNQRLQRVMIKPPNKKTVLKILESFLNLYAPDVRIEENLLQYIYDYSERFLPAQKQPRKSVMLLDDLLGWNKACGLPLSKQTLNEVLKSKSNIMAEFDIDIDKVSMYLKERIINQDYAIDSVMDRLHLSVADLSDESKPQGSFLFTGATGVGKTELAKGIARGVFGSDRAMIRFDMSEFGEEGRLDFFREELTSKVSANPYCVILLDEIEKAHESITLLLLQVLDDGRLNNRYGREVIFTNSYIIVTTNVGKETYALSASYSANNMHEQINPIKEALKNNPSFPTELLNRFDRIVPFNTLNSDARDKIASIGLSKLQAKVKEKHNVNVRFENDVLQYIVSEVGSEATDDGGGRGVRRIIEEYIATNIAKYINRHPTEKNLAVHVEGLFRSKEKTRLASTAYVVVASDALAKSPNTTFTPSYNSMQRGVQ